jgi:hypothetical protein
MKGGQLAVDITLVYRIGVYDRHLSYSGPTNLLGGISSHTS